MTCTSAFPSLNTGCATKNCRMRFSLIFVVVLFMLILSMDGVDAKKGKKKGRSKAKKKGGAENVVVATDTSGEEAGFPLGRNDLYSYRYQQKIRQKVLVPFVALCTRRSFMRRRLISIVESGDGRREETVGA